MPKSKLFFKNAFWKIHKPTSSIGKCPFHSTFSQNVANLKVKNCNSLFALNLELQILDFFLFDFTWSIFSLFHQWLHAYKNLFQSQVDKYLIVILCFIPESPWWCIPVCSSLRRVYVKSHPCAPYSLSDLGRPPLSETSHFLGGDETYL